MLSTMSQPCCQVLTKSHNISGLEWVPYNVQKSRGEMERMLQVAGSQPCMIPEMGSSRHLKIKAGSRVPAEQGKSPSNQLLLHFASD